MHVSVMLSYMKAEQRNKVGIKTEVSGSLDGLVVTKSHACYLLGSPS